MNRLPYFENLHFVRSMIITTLISIEQRVQQCDHFLTLLLLLICILPYTNPPNFLWPGNCRCHSAESTSIHSNKNIRFGQHKQICHCRTQYRSFSVKIRVSSHHIGIRECFVPFRRRVISFRA